MNLRAHPIPLCLYLVAPAFACQVDTQLDPGADSAAGGSSGDATPDDSDTEDSTADSSGGPQAAFCVDGDPTAPVAIIATASTATLLRADTSEVALDVPPLDPTLPEPTTSFTGRGGLIAMARTSIGFDEVQLFDSTVALLTVAGERLWSHDDPGRGINRLATFISEGTILASTTRGGGVYEGVVYGPATVREMPGFDPSGPPRADGLIPGSRVEGLIPTHGWLDPETSAFQARLGVGSVFARPGGALVSFEDRTGVLTLVHESPSQLTEIPLSGIPLHYADRTDSSPDGTWVLLNDPLTSTWLRVEVTTGAVRTLDLTPPDGREPFGCDRPEALVDDAGRVVMAVRDASSVTVLRHDPDTGEWETLGEAVTDLEAMQLDVYGDTYVIGSFSPAPSCPPTSFEPGPATLSGTTVQIVRPSDGISRVGDDRWVSTSPDGRCVALIGFGIGATTTMIDLREGTEIELPGDIQVTWWDG